VTKQLDEYTMGQVCHVLFGLFWLCIRSLLTRMRTSGMPRIIRSLLAISFDSNAQHGAGGR
jgi:hypothetical protein